MAIDFKRTKLDGHFPEIWRGAAKMLPGGFKPVQTFPVGTVLRRGTLLFVDFAAKTAAVCKSAKVLDGGTTTKVRVAKGTLFAIGDVITKVGDGKATPNIKSIDTSNAEYDEITLSAAYTGLAKGDVIVESKAVAENATAAPLYTPNTIVGAEKEFDGKGLPTIDAAYEAVVLYPAVAYAIVPEWVQGICLKSNPNILFIEQ